MGVEVVPITVASCGRRTNCVVVDLRSRHVPAARLDGGSLLASATSAIGAQDRLDAARQLGGGARRRSSRSAGGCVLIPSHPPPAVSASGAWCWSTVFRWPRPSTATIHGCRCGPAGLVTRWPLRARRRRRLSPSGLPHADCESRSPTRRRLTTSIELVVSGTRMPRDVVIAGPRFGRRRRQHGVRTS